MKMDMGDITIQNRAMIFKVTVPTEDITRTELNEIEREFKIATKMQMEATLGTDPRNPQTCDIWCKIVYGHIAAVSIPFTLETMKSILLSTFRSYFAPQL
jgi:hypothetical protein